jgi:hypothetical protein
MNSSPVGMFSSSGGIRDFVSTEANDCNLGRVEEAEDCDTIRERIVSFRATSNPLRSSAGCGSWDVRD